MTFIIEYYSEWILFQHQLAYLFRLDSERLCNRRPRKILSLMFLKVLFNFIFYFRYSTYLSIILCNLTFYAIYDK